MKFLTVALSALLLATVALSHPHHGPGGHGHGPGHQHPHSSSESSSDESDCGKPPLERPEWKEFVNDLRDFVALYPIEDIKEIVGAHLQDAELQNTIAFVQSAEFEAIAEQIKESAEVQAVVQYLMDADWPWVQRMLRTAMQQRRAMRMLGRSGLAANETVGGGLDGLLDDIIAVLPKEELRALFDDKMANRPVFRAVMAILGSDELRQLQENVRNSETLRPLFARIEENGIHGEKIREFMRALLGL